MIAGICALRRAGVLRCPGHRWRSALLVALALAAGGCQLSEKRPASETPSEPQQSEATVDLSAAIGHLERGEEERARALLLKLRDKTPGSEVVDRLLRQIDVPARELLPGPYREIEVSAGDSLSLIAGRELGDPLLFYALARLNGIEAPARIPTGTLVQIPVADGAQSGTPGKVPASAGISAAEIDSVVAHMARNGQREQARRMLIDWLAQGEQKSASAQRRLVEITLQEVSGAGFDGQVDKALALVDEALAVIDVPPARAQLVQTRSGLRSRKLYRLALALEEQGDLQTAHARAAEAAALDSAPQDAERLAESLEVKVVDLLHGRALVAWRNRNVDLAIRNWESVLEIAPDFEPAQVYVERAKRLRRRLEQP